MDDIYDDLIPFINRAETPKWVFPLLQKTGTNGMKIKEFGGAGLNNLECGVICFEIAKRDASISTAFLVHNGIGSAVIEACGDDEQRARLLPGCNTLEKICCFCLSEPLNGSDATGLKSSARKVDGGYILNGQKRWPGNATFADYHMVWARNEAENNAIQCFVVTKGSPGMKAT